MSSKNTNTGENKNKKHSKKDKKDKEKEKKRRRDENSSSEDESGSVASSDGERQQSPIKKQKTNIQSNESIPTEKPHRDEDPVSSASITLQPTTSVKDFQPPSNAPVVDVTQPPPTQQPPAAVNNTDNKKNLDNNKKEEKKPDVGLKKKPSIRPNMPEFVPQPLPLAFEDTLSRDVLRKLSLSSIAVNNPNSRMWDVFLGNSKHQFLPPPLKCIKGHYHGVGEKGAENMGDESRKMKARFARIIPSVDPAKPNKNLTEDDKRFLEFYPAVVERERQFSQAINGSYYNRIIQLYIAATHPTLDDLWPEIEAKCGLLNITSIDAANPTSKVLADSAIKTQLVEDLLESKEQIARDYGKILQTLINEEKKKMNNWVNKGGKKGQKSDAEKGIDAITVGRKFLFSTKKKEKDNKQGNESNSANQQGGGNNNASNANNNSGGGFNKNADQNKARDLDADTKEGDGDDDRKKESEEYNGEEDFQPEEGSGFDMPRAEMNKLLFKLTGGKNPPYRYSRPTWKNYKGIIIDRKGKPVQDPFLEEEDMAAPVCSAVISEIAKTGVFVTLNSNEIYYYSKGNRPEKVSSDVYENKKEEDGDTNVPDNKRDDEHQHSNSQRGKMPVSGTVVQ